MPDDAASHIAKAIINLQCAFRRHGINISTIGLAGQKDGDHLLNITKGFIGVPFPVDQITFGHVKSGIVSTFNFSGTEINWPATIIKAENNTSIRIGDNEFKLEHIGTSSSASFTFGSNKLFTHDCE